MRNEIYKVLNEIAREAWKDAETEKLRHEVRKANKGIRHLKGQVKKYSFEAQMYFDNYWNLRHKIYMTLEERKDYNDIVRYFVQQGKVSQANLLVNLQKRFDNAANGR